MGTWYFEAPLVYWLASTAISIISFVMTTAMNACERQRRKQPDSIFASKYLSVFSRLCIAMGPITTLIATVSFVPGMCLISGHLRGPSLFMQIVAMECYQLSRLYYCFSRDQVHSDKGYPKWIFCALLFVLTMWFSVSVAIRLTEVTTECGIHGDGNAVMEGLLLFAVPSWVWMIPNTLFCIFEFTTVSLYWFKVLAMRSLICRNETNCAVFDRIQSVLHRVLILTYFYVAVNGMMVMVSYAATIVVDAGLIPLNISWIWPYSINSVAISYSMFLMQDHNISEYIAFLRFIKRYKCGLCFCCFQFMVNEQYRMLVENVDERKIKDMVSNTEVTSPKHKNTNTGMELSIATRTEITLEVVSEEITEEVTGEAVDQYKD